MKETDEKYMREAIQEAEKTSQRADWGMGAVVVVGGKIVGRGGNSGFSDKNRLAHAEIKALTQARVILEKNRSKATMYCTYEPCPMCFGAALVMKIRKVVVGVDLDKSGGLELRHHLPPFYRQEKFKMDVTRGILEKECKEVCLQSKPGVEHFGKFYKIIKNYGTDQ